MIMWKSNKFVAFIATSVFLAGCAHKPINTQANIDLVSVAVPVSQRSQSSGLVFPNLPSSIVVSEITYSVKQRYTSAMGNTCYRLQPTIEKLKLNYSSSPVICQTFNGWEVISPSQFGS